MMPPEFDRDAMEGQGEGLRQCEGAGMGHDWRSEAMDQQQSAQNSQRPQAIPQQPPLPQQTPVPRPPQPSTPPPPPPKQQRERESRAAVGQKSDEGKGSVLSRVTERTGKKDKDWRNSRSREPRRRSPAREVTKGLVREREVLVERDAREASRAKESAAHRRRIRLLEDQVKSSKEEVNDLKDRADTRENYIRRLKKKQRGKKRNSLAKRVESVVKQLRYEESEQEDNDMGDEPEVELRD